MTPDQLRRTDAIVPPSPQLYHGPFRGKVVAVDPARCQVQVMVPEVSGDAALPLAWPRLPAPSGIDDAGKPYGAKVLPPIGSAVWVEFEGGDPSYPVWAGGWWGADEMPEVLAKHAENRAGLIARSGSYVIVDDDAGGDADSGRVEFGITFDGSTFYKLAFDLQTKTAILSHPSGAQVRLEDAAASLVDASAGQKLKLQAAQGATQPVALKGHKVNAGTMTLVMVSGAAALQYTPPGGAPTVYPIGTPVPLEGVIDEGSAHTESS